MEKLDPRGEDVIDVLIVLKPREGSKDVLKRALLGSYDMPNRNGGIASSGRMEREQIHQIRFDPEALRIVKRWILERAAANDDDDHDGGSGDGEDSDTRSRPLHVEHLPLSRHVYLRGRVKIFERVFRTELVHVPTDNIGGEWTATRPIMVPPHIRRKIDGVFGLEALNAEGEEDIERVDHGQVRRRASSEMLRAERKRNLLEETVDIDPARLRSIYDIRQDCEVNGTQSFSTSVSVLSNGLDRFSQSDLDLFNAVYNLPDVAVETDIVSEDDVCVSNPSRCMESNLDTQYVSSTARGCRVRFEKIGSNGRRRRRRRRLNLATRRKASSLVDRMTAFQHRSLSSKEASSVFSVSYGIGEMRATESEKTFFADWIMETALAGTVVVVSSGDDGAKGVAGTCDLFDTNVLASPYALVVGATALKRVASSEEEEEEVACQCSQNARAPKITTGGGFSSLYTDDSVLRFQRNVTSAYLETLRVDGGKYPKSTAFVPEGRGYPDVALVGQNYVVYIGGDAYLQDGTSASTPVVAGMLAVVQSMRALRGRNPLPGWLNPTLYEIYAAKGGSDIFQDITRGDNTCGRFQETPTSSCTSCCEMDQDGGFGWRAIEGWDAATGLGSFNFTALAEKLLEIDTPPLPSDHGADAVNLGIIVGLTVAFFFTVATLVFALVALKRRSKRSEGMLLTSMEGFDEEDARDYLDLLEVRERNDAAADRVDSSGGADNVSTENDAEREEEEEDGGYISPSAGLLQEKDRDIRVDDGAGGVVDLSRLTAL